MKLKTVLVLCGCLSAFATVEAGPEVGIKVITGVVDSITSSLKALVPIPSVTIDVNAFTPSAAEKPLVQKTAPAEPVPLKSSQERAHLNCFCGAPAELSRQQFRERWQAPENFDRMSA